MAGKPVAVLEQLDREIPEDERPGAVAYLMTGTDHPAAPLLGAVLAIRWGLDLEETAV